MTLTQITHHDLDGYGASTLAAALAEVARVVHVPRYGDVGPVVEEELKRLTRAPAAETLLMTDLGLEEPAVAFLRRFASLNRRRDAGTRHRLIVLDHHVSSVDQLRAGGFDPSPDPDRPGLLRFDLGDPDIHVLIQDGVCATRMTSEHRALFATGAAAGADEERADGQAAGRAEDDRAALVAAIDALDLWRKDRPEFAGGLALDELFWDNVATLIPVGHPWHDPFVSGLLTAAAGLLREGASPAELERRVSGARIDLVDRMMQGEPDDDLRLTTRMRIARVLARSDVLFRPLTDGTLLSFGLDPGTFQRVSDLVMEGGRARRVCNVQRTGSLSFRSNDGTALDAARRFRGGGHRDAAGGRLPNGTVHSQSEAMAQVEPVLNPPAADPAASPFAALKDWKG